MCKYLIRVCNCLHYQVRHFYDISWQEITLPRFYGVHVANNDVLHPPRRSPQYEGKAVEKHVYIYLAWFLLLKMPYTGNFFLYYIFYFLFIFIIVMCKNSFSMGICFYIIFFLLSFYIYQFLCVSICLVAVEKHVYIYLAWFLLLKMPYTGNFFLYNFFLLSFYIYHFYV